MTLRDAYSRMLDDAIDEQIADIKRRDWFDEIGGLVMAAFVTGLVLGCVAARLLVLER